MPVFIVFPLAAAASPGSPITQDELFSAEDIRRIEIEGRWDASGIVLRDELDLTVRVVQEQRRDIAVRLSGDIRTNRSSALPRLHTNTRGGTLRVELTPEIRFQLFLRLSGAAILSVHIPASWQEELEVRTASAAVQCDSLRLRSLACRTASGQLVLRRVESDAVSLGSSSGRMQAESLTGGNISIESSSGSIEVQQVLADRIIVRTSSGAQRFSAISGELTAESASGNLFYAFSKQNRAARLKSSSGSITAENLNGNVRLNTSSGSIRFTAGSIRGPVTIESTSGSVEGTIEHDQGFELSIKTASGRITVDMPVAVRGSMQENRLQGVVGSGGELLQIETSSGNVFIR